MNTKISPPSTIRLTIPVDSEVHAIFQRMAQAGNVSTGRAMGEWLKDTSEAAELMAATMERARVAPKLVTAELHAMMLGLTDHTKELMDKFSKFKSKEGAAAGGARLREGSAAVLASVKKAVGEATPPSNTGVNYQKQTRTPRGKT
jgi:hypothetical protein